MTPVTVLTVCTCVALTVVSLCLSIHRHSGIHVGSFVTAWLVPPLYIIYALAVPHLPQSFEQCLDGHTSRLKQVHAHEYAAFEEAESRQTKNQMRLFGQIQEQRRALGEAVPQNMGDLTPDEKKRVAASVDPETEGKINGWLALVNSNDCKQYLPPTT